MERAKNCCEFCGVKNYDTGFRDKSGVFYNDSFIIQQLELHGIDMFDEILSTSKHIRIVLTIAHLDHDINNNDPSNLKALCQKCHLNYDKEHHRKNTKETLNKKKGLVDLPFTEHLT
ncbi:MAG: hypothetical protein M0P09_07245 [Acholeplasmataceae bacterium]|nr:hypothetical protein [Acholeplasmataceae bacterium]